VIDDQFWENDLRQLVRLADRRGISRIRSIGPPWRLDRRPPAAAQWLRLYSRASRALPPRLALVPWIYDEFDADLKRRRVDPAEERKRSHTGTAFVRYFPVPIAKSG